VILEDTGHCHYTTEFEQGVVYQCEIFCLVAWLDGAFFEACVLSLTACRLVAIEMVNRAAIRAPCRERVLLLLGVSSRSGCELLEVVHLRRLSAR